MPSDPDEALVRVDVANVAFAEPPADVVSLELPLRVGLALALATSLSNPAVIVTGKVVTSPSSPPFSYVTVLLPGKFADVPAALSLQTALADVMLQSCVAVKSLSPGNFESLVRNVIARSPVSHAPSYRHDRPMAHMS